MLFKRAITYDDVLLVPKFSSVLSRKDVCLKTRLTRNITLNTPLISSNMDTVTEAKMAIALAKNGGIGIIHRFNTIEQQVEEVRKVKRAEAFIIKNPHCVNEDDKISDILRLMDQYKIKSFLVTNEYDKLVGIITERDIRFLDDIESRVWQHMTTDLFYYIKNRNILVTPKEQIEFYGLNEDTVKEIFCSYKLKKLPIVNSEMMIEGLITAKDFYYSLKNRKASHDSEKRFLVGAAVGVKKEDIDRALALVEADIDCLVLDIAHGHSAHCLNMLKELKKRVNVDIIAGNIATGEGALDLAKAGADAIKIGVGPGSICTTRIVTGCGVPQLTAILDSVKSLRENKIDIPCIADGGIKTSGDIVKALAAGAETVMLGSLFAGTDEAPGLIINKNGKKVKIVRGMAGVTANLKMDKVVVPEGVEATVAYKGSVSEIIKNMIGGISSGLSYCGSNNLEELREKAEFIEISGQSLRESHSHDVDL